MEPYTVKLINNSLLNIVSFFTMESISPEHAVYASV